MNVYYEKDADLSYLQGKNIAVLGYGSQGHAHALNLKESGLNVRVGLRPESASCAKAREAGLEVTTVAEATKWADIVMVLLPDQNQKAVYDAEIAPNLVAGNTLAFGHGFNIHYKQIIPAETINVIMIAPKSPGHLVRRTFTQGNGVPCLIAVHQDYTGDAKQQALAWAKALGGTTWQSGGDMWVVVFHRSDGKVVGLTDESICLYADERALEGGKPDESMLLT